MKWKKLRVGWAIFLLNCFLGDVMGENVFVFKSIVLNDVQGLFGGQNVYLTSEGKGFVQRVDRSRQEKRYRIKLSSVDINALRVLIEKSDLENLIIPDRNGIPDEARPTLVLTLSNGKVVSVSKWDRDKNERFDEIYSWLLREVRRTENKKPIYTGRYDPEPKAIIAVFKN